MVWNVRMLDKWYRFMDALAQPIVRIEFLIKLVTQFEKSHMDKTKGECHLECIREMEARAYQSVYLRVESDTTTLSTHSLSEIDSGSERY